MAELNRLQRARVPWWRPFKRVSLDREWLALADYRMAVMRLMEKEER